MAIEIIPLISSIDAYKFRVTIQEQVFVFDLHWNTRDDRWFLQIFDINNDHIISTPLVVNHLLFRRLHLENLFTQPMALMNIVNNNECVKAALGESCKLFTGE